MPDLFRRLGTALAIAMLTCSHAAAAGSAFDDACTEDFQCDLSQPVDPGLFEPDRWASEVSLCAARPGLLTPTAEGLGFLLQDVAGAKNGCGYGGLRSRRYYGYGSFSIRLKAGIKPGETAAFFLINRWKPEGWQQKEIDVEFLGKDRRGVQFNVHDEVHGQGNGAGAPQWVPLDFDVGAGFHVYGIRWAATEVIWSVDGKDRAKASAHVPDEPLMIMTMLWAPDPALSWPAAWVGHLDRTAWPSQMVASLLRYDSF
jgi:hypothetical protein